MPLSSVRVLKQFRYAMYFNGVNNYVVVPHNPALNIQPGNVITIIMIANFLGWRIDFSVGIPIDKRTERYANYNWEFNSSTMQMRVHANGSVWAVSVPHSLGVWNHYAMVLNGSWLGGYLNDVLMNSRNDVPQSSGNTVNLYIGMMYAAAYHVKSYIAQVLIYSKTLSGSEILWNYLYPDNPVRNGLVLWLQADPQYVKDIDGDGRLEWVDLSGFGNHGKIYGATLVELIKTPKRILTPQRILSVVR
jgi:hypothetical protein